MNKKMEFFLTDRRISHFIQSLSFLMGIGSSDEKNKQKVSPPRASSVLTERNRHRKGEREGVRERGLKDPKTDLEQEGAMT